jgi:hypothetical protein
MRRRGFAIKAADGSICCLPPDMVGSPFERSRASIVEASPFDREPEIYLTEEIRIV